MSYIAKLLVKARSSRILYKWSLSVKGLSRLYPSRATDILVDGFGRSGNTFMVEFLKEWLGPVTLSHHLHSIASLKEACRLNLSPIIVLIRKPEQAVASAVIKNKNDFKYKPLGVTSYFLEEWKMFYSYVLKNNEKFIIVDYSTVFSDELYNSFKVIFDEESLSKDKFDIIKEKVNDGLQMDKRHEFKRKVPSKLKELEKEKCIEAMKDSLLLKQCQKIYEELCQENSYKLYN